MRVFAGDPYMHDPGLRNRLGQVEIPVLVLWGDSDRIVTPGYGQALAAMFPQAEFAVVNQAGHLPQLEQPAATFGALDAFVARSGVSAGSPRPCTTPSWSPATRTPLATAGAEKHCARVNRREPCR